MAKLGHNSAKKILSAKALKDIKAKTFNRYFIFNLYPTLLEELEMIDSNSSLDYMSF